MMSPDNIPPKPATKEDTQSSGSRKTTPMRPPEQSLNCPRCDSPNTKFCYYNNYSLTQPRHFCKTCRRYWTKGGALRNVPIGGGCRKNKKMKSSSSRLSGDSKDSSGESSDMGGLKFFHGLSPAMDFQLGGLSLSRLNSSSSTPPSVFNHFSSFGDISNPNPNPNLGFGVDPTGFSFNQEMGSMNSTPHSNIASSIESLSSINQDLHWKLQQQRLAMLFGGENNNNQKSNNFGSLDLENHNHQKPQPILFQNLEISKPPEVCGVGSSRKESTSSGNNHMATEWLFDNSYAPVDTPQANISGNGHENTGNNWNGIQAWSDLNQYSALP